MEEIRIKIDQFDSSIYMRYYWEQFVGDNKM
jgi:hypothetical protein